MTAHALLPILLLASGLHTAPPNLWVLEKGDPGLWREVRSAFQAELLPDDPAKTAPVVAHKYKYIARVARAGDSCLVIIGQRESRRGPGWGPDSFVVVNYNLKSHQKTGVTKGAFLGWRFVSWAFLVPGSYPELIFRHQSCAECEADYLLSSVFLDPASGEWTMRRWTKDDDSILIGEDWTAGNDPDWRTACLLRVADFFGTGKTEIAVWCRRIFDDRGRNAEETLSLYSVEAGKPTTVTPDATQGPLLKRDLCRAQPSHVFCRKRP
jgi:hypothetical protein